MQLRVCETNAERTRPARVGHPGGRRPRATERGLSGARCASPPPTPSVRAICARPIGGLRVSFVAAKAVSVSACRAILPVHRLHFDGVFWRHRSHKASALAALEPMGRVVRLAANTSVRPATLILASHATLDRKRVGIPRADAGRASRKRRRSGRLSDLVGARATAEVFG